MSSIRANLMYFGIVLIIQIPFFLQFNMLEAKICFIYMCSPHIDLIIVLNSNKDVCNSKSIFCSAFT